jgi:pimeloyl-CoA dehydrogenase
MDFALNDDHLALRDAVQRFCEGEYPAEHRGNPETQAQTRQRWQAMAELGLLGLPLSSDMGGSDQGPVEVMLVAQELGRALGGGAWLSSTVMAGQLLTALGTSAQQQRWLPMLANGTLQAALALYERGTRYEWQQVSTRAVAEGDAYRVSGHKTLVLQGDSAQLLLVVARTSGQEGDRDGLAVFAIDADTPGVQVQGFDTLDGRRAAHIRLEQVRVNADQCLGAPGQAVDALEAIVDAANAALCAEAAGVVEALIAHTAEHLRTRKQFGAPLAKFQVLQHRVADMAIALEQLKSMACAAAAAVAGTDAAQRRRVVSAAKVFASQQGREIGLAAIQLHGGMGMTDECRVGHCTKRLLVIGQLFGDAAWHLQRVAATA